MKNKLPTLQDVAREAGVSAMTVSRVVNNHPRISDETTSKVKAIITKLGYSTAASARKRGRRSRAKEGIHTGQIAVVTLGLTGSALKIPVFATTLLGVQNALQDADLSMLVTPVTDFMRLPGLLDRRSVDGVIVTGYAPSSELRKLFKELPAVYVYDIHADESLEVDRVVPDNVAIGEIAANYLLAEGCQHVAFLDPSPSHPEFGVRGREFTKNFEAGGGHVTSFIYGMGKTDDHLGDPDMKEGILEEQVDQLINFEKIDSLFIPSDRLTARVYAYLRKKGIDPATYKIISCNNEAPYLEGLFPHPATIEIGAEEIGHEAVKQLLHQLADRNGTSKKLTVKPKLVIPSI